jgi:hypothetical protein
MDLETFHSHLHDIVKSYHQHGFYASDIEKIRLWRLASTETIDTFFTYVYKCCRQTTGTDYFIDFKGDYLNPRAENKTFRELTLDTGDYLFADVMDKYHQFSFYNPDLPRAQKCECCYKFDYLKFVCACKKVTSVFVEKEQSFPSLTGCLLHISMQRKGQEVPSQSLRQGR